MSLLKERMQHPRHLGAMPDADAVGAVGNPACGDVVTIYLRFAGDRIDEARFESIGSAYQLATASVLCDCVLGETALEARARGPGCVLKRLPDLPERYQYLARLSIEALQRALDGRSGETGPERGAAAHRGLTPDEAKRFLESLMQPGKKWRTVEIEAMAQADHVALPGGTARFLAGLRKAGELEAEMDVETRSWVWFRPEGGPAP